MAILVAVELILSLFSIISKSGALLFLSSGKAEHWPSLSMLRTFPTLWPRLPLHCVYILVYCSIPSETSQLCLLPTSTFSWNVILLSFMAPLHDIPSHAMLHNRMRSCRLKGHLRKEIICINTKFILDSFFFKHFRKHSILHTWQKWIQKHCVSFSRWQKKIKSNMSQDIVPVR